ncbi:MAG: T9SS type A sorting domain-containing protein [bacterium]|nr:T9SS type A sorting domain-containing protein [bacterium]
MEQREARLRLSGRLVLYKLEGIKSPPKKWLILSLCIIVSLMLSSAIEIKQELPFGDDSGNRFSPIYIDTLKLLSIPFTTDTSRIYTDILLKNNEYDLSLYDSLVSGWIVGYGYFDLDEKLDFLCNNYADSLCLFIIEQKTTDSISKEWTWSTGSVFDGGLYSFETTSLLKGDGIDRIYGAPNPNTTVSEPYGWFYMESNGDDSYEFAYEDTFSRKVYAMDIGYMDNDSLLDVVTMTHLGQKVYESKNMNQDSFVSVANPLGGGYYYTEILGDLDNDGFINYIGGGKAYDQSPAEWLHDVMECKGDNSYDTIWSHWIRKDYGPWGSVASGCGGTAGDMDGDGDDELVLCAGSIIEVFEVMGDDSFEMVWSMDNDTFAGSSVIMTDMNGNGKKEVVWSGRSDPYLPYTYGIDMMKTYILEWRMLNTPDTISYGNAVTPDTLRSDRFFIYNEGADTVLVDSIGFKDSEFFVDTALTYPLQVYPNDSLIIRTAFYTESIGYHESEIYVYGDKNRYKTMLRGGLGIECRIDSIKASDGFIAQNGVDSDDYVIVYFHGLTNQPEIDSTNIEDILSLNNGHTWLNIDSTFWLDRVIQKDRLRIEFKDTNSTISVGDTVYPDSLTITETLFGVPCFNSIAIIGNLGPEGTEERHELKEVTELQSIRVTGCNTIEWITQTTQGILTVYDISGREVIREESKTTGAHKTDIRQLKNGVYFIKLKESNKTIAKKHLLIR